MKKLLLTFVLFTSFLSFAQVPTVQHHNYYYNNTKSMSLDGFKYKNQYYETRPSGLKSFINENSEIDGELKRNLTKKMKSIRNRDLIANVAGWGAWVTGAGIMLNEAITKNEDGQQFKSSTLFTGLGVAVLGSLIREFVRPKQKHYYDFINTFNRAKNDKIKLEVTVDYTKQMNFGIAMSF